MKKYRNIMLVFLILFGSIIIFSCSYFNYMLTPVSKNSEIKKITVESGSSTASIAKLLKENKLIKNETIFKLYVKLTSKETLKATTYEFSENMGVKKIVKLLEEGNIYNPDEVRITFKEGINVRKFASLIEEYTNNSSKLFIDTMSDETYLDTLIDKYWFLTADIKNEKIYYPLEGYLFPNTYYFKNSDVTVKEIIEKILDETEKKLNEYKQDLTNNKDYSIHELITLASIVELEGANSNDRAGVAGVFYNRLESDWSLGSDVTTYYAEKINMSDRDLYQTEIDDCSNGYNTRCKTLIGLPIGPISNPGIISIKSVISPSQSDYYYFVADKNGKTYFNKTYKEHQNTIQKLKNSDMWYQY